MDSLHKQSVSSKLRILKSSHSCGNKIILQTTKPTECSLIEANLSFHQRNSSWRCTALRNEIPILHHLQLTSKEDPPIPACFEEGEPQWIEEVVENKGLRRRYSLHSSSSPKDEKLPTHIPLLLQRQKIRDFFLPAGFPSTVCPEYFHYMLWEFPVHATGWTCSTLVTSSLLSAVGLPSSPQLAASASMASSAAIKWVSKDGIGSLGRLFVGGRFGSLFDEDPRQWRMYADVLGSVGSLFELATPLAPGSFLLLASLGNVTKAVCRGLKDPSARVMQTHLASSDNIGQVAAKQEVWNVLGQLTGLVGGVALLSEPHVASSYWTLVAAWASVRTLHLTLRYFSLKVLCFPTINFKRAAILVRSHVQGLPVPNQASANEKESILVPRYLTQPRMVLGSSVEAVLGAIRGDSGKSRSKALRELVRLYKEEAFFLTREESGVYIVALREGFSGRDIIRSMWQAAWLDNWLEKKGGSERGIGFEQLSKSIGALNKSFSNFEEEAILKGWDLSRVTVQVTQGAPVFKIK